jgi:tagatose 1,6-diphosphate aldolase GatY/KbaY
VPLVTSKKILQDARNGRYAVPAFNIENMEMAQAVIETAEEMDSPVIVQTTPSTVRYAGIGMLKAIVYEKAKCSPVPVVLHLDHGESFNLIIEAIRAGYTSLMIDGSGLGFEENISLTKKVVDIARVLNIPVEAELGRVGGKEDKTESGQGSAYTDPGEAEEFVAMTGIDSLAVAIGTAHGFYKGTPKLDFDRLSAIRDKIEVPLVLHGASGVPDEAVKKAIELGICKVNFATELRAAMTRGVREALEDKGIFDPKAYLARGKNEVKKVVKRKIMLCQSTGKAARHN